MFAPRVLRRCAWVPHKEGICRLARGAASTGSARRGLARHPGLCIAAPHGVSSPGGATLAAGAARRCSSEQQSSEQKQEQKSSDRKFVAHITERSISDLVDSLLLPLRHTVYSANLLALRIAFPGSWDADEFHVGVPHAFRQVTENLDLQDRDTRPLAGLVSEALLEELKDAAARKSEKEATASGPRVKFSEVLDVRLRGIFTVSAKADENGDAAVWVTGLLSAVEKYESASTGDAEEEGAEATPPRIGSFHVKRLHKWTFKRLLPSEAGELPGDWQVEAINKKRWKPPRALRPPPRA